MMFGHQDDSQDTKDQSTDNNLTVPVADGLLSHDHATAPIVADFNPALPTSSSEPAASSGDFSLPSGASDDATATPPSEPIETNQEPASTPDPVTPSEPAIVVSDDLLAIKQQALTQLTPLVDQLDQSPEEKFRTTMMMIQAADNKDLVKTAYEAAQAIVDEKVKAQALLDIVNEINYFTQHSA